MGLTIFQPHSRSKLEPEVDTHIAELGVLALDDSLVAQEAVQVRSDALRDWLVRWKYLAMASHARSGTYEEHEICEGFMPLWKKRFTHDEKGYHFDATVHHKRHHTFNGVQPLSPLPELSRASSKSSNLIIQQKLSEAILLQLFSSFRPPSPLLVRPHSQTAGPNKRPRTAMEP